MGEAFFIDRDGNQISSEGIQSHVGLAQLIINSNEELKTEYDKSTNRDIVDFLVEQNGYLKITRVHFNESLEYFGPKTSLTQRKLIMHYYEEGYRIVDISRAKLKEDDEECR